MTENELLAIIGEEDTARRNRLVQGGRLVHYTSAEAAYRIISGSQIWLRSAAVMNDFSEISHGIRCLQAAWSSPDGVALQAMLDRIREGLRNDLASLFDGHANGFRNDTFITSLSDHSDDEDELGRLSMWRAYGGKTGVALVLNPYAFAGTTDAMRVYSAPVLYADEAMFVTWFQNWAGRLLISEEALRRLDPDAIRNLLFLMFRIFAMCTKHPGFAEEREWRVFTSPVHEGSSPWLEYGVETIKGVPQPLVKMKLIDDEAADVRGVAPRTLLNRVIIGPCEYPLQVNFAMRDAMQKVGVENIDDKIWMSLIPLRHS
jgi:hypothetical protein